MRRAEERINEEAVSIIDTYIAPLNEPYTAVSDDIVHTTPFATRFTRRRWVLILCHAQRRRPQFHME